MWKRTPCISEGRIIMSEPINIMNDKGEFTPEFKELVDKYVDEEIQKVCTDGKLDYSKMLEYIKEHAKKDPMVIQKVLNNMRGDKK